MMLQSNLNRPAPNASSISLNRYISLHNRNDVGVNDPKYISAFNKDNIGVSEASIYNYRGIDCCEKGKFDEGIEHFNEAIALVPKFAGAYYNRGTAYAHKGDFDAAAINDYTKAIQLNPNDASAYCNRGTVYRRNDEFDLALADFNKAVSLDPKFAIAYFQRGFLYFSKDEREKAIKDFHKTIELRPDFAQGYNLLGLYYSAKGEYKQAIKDFSRAIELKENFSGISALDAEFIVLTYIGRAGAYYEDGRFHQAIEDLNTALSLVPEDFYAYCVRGMVYHGIGEIDLSIADFTKAIELYPKFAEVYVRRRIELNPKLEEVYVSRGMAYTKKGELERAIVDYTKAIDLKPDYADAYYRRSKVWLRLGEVEKAKADMQTASKIGINSSTALDETLQNYDRAWKALGNL